MGEDRNSYYVLPSLTRRIQETDHVGIIYMRSVVYLYCGAWLRPGERIINEASFKDIAKKYL